VSAREQVSAARPRIYQVIEGRQAPEAIEAASFAAIDAEVPGHGFTPGQWRVVQRMIHASADFAIARSARFSAGGVEAGVAALRAGRPLYVDSNMIRAGLSLARLRRANPAYGPERVFCHIADEDVARAARAAGLPRSLYAVRKAKAMLDGGIAVFGNAPVALLELNRMIVEDGVRPAFVVALPVGFVHVIESKDELMGLGVPYVAVAGRKGGSPLAVAAVHALCSLAEEAR
jgi:precorrin isomerase